MLRSMYSGISGLRNSQTKLDVVGNNIANVNTYGFKKGRITFKDMVSQNMAGATGSSIPATNIGGVGGTNPGMAILRFMMVLEHLFILVLVISIWMPMETWLAQRVIA